MSSLLTGSSRVVVIEVKRDFDRGQLAQALEHAGWAQRTSLDEVAQFYRGQHGTDFFEAWREFGEAGVLEVLNPRPRMILVSQELHPRTRAAVDFMMSSGMSVEVRGVTIHIGEQQDLIVEVVGGGGGPGGGHTSWLVAAASSKRDAPGASVEDPCAQTDVPVDAREQVLGFCL